MVLPLYPILVVFLTLEAILLDAWDNVARSATAGGALFFLYFALAFAYPAGLGFGDVKLSGALGISLGWLGWPHLALGAGAAVVINALIVAVLLTFRRIRPKSHVPYGPSMILGAAVGAVWGPTFLSI